MTVLEDFEDLVGWTEEQASGTVTFQDTVRVVGNAARFGTANGGIDLAYNKTFNEDEYGIYMRTDHADNDYNPLITIEQGGGATLLYVYMHSDGNFGTTTGNGNWVDSGVGYDVDTWYWIGFKRNADDDQDIRIYNEAKTVLLFSILGTDGRDGRSWETGDSRIVIALSETDGNTFAYFDELTDEGTVPPPPAGQFMVPQKYW